MTSNRTALVARVLMAAIFLIAGARKLLMFSATAGYFGKLGMPMPDVFVALSILVEIGGGLALIIGWRLPIASLVLAVFTMVAAFLAHQFWAASPADYSGQLNNFLKNVAMTGGFLLLYEVSRQRAT